MRIIERPDVAQQLLDLARKQRPGRHKGWHQSDVNGCLRQAVVKKLIDRDDIEIEEGLDLMFLRGEGIHHFLAEGKPELVFEAEGVGWCSVDRLWEDEAGDTSPMELKSTRYSSAYPITEHANYIVQLSTYMVKMLHMNHIEVEPAKEYKGYLYVMYEMGDYATRFPEQRCFQLLISGTELLKWEEILRQRYSQLRTSYDELSGFFTQPGNEMELEKLRDLVAVDVDLTSMLPPLAAHWGFQCEYCSIKELISCEGTKHNAEYGNPFFVEEAKYTKEHKERKAKKVK